jgi:uncharacterized protein DUF6166
VSQSSMPDQKRDGIVYRGARKPYGDGFVTVKPPGKRARLLGLRSYIRRLAKQFDWCKDSPGARQLAIALLADATGDDRLAYDAHPAYCADVIEYLKPAGWTLTHEDVLRWVRKYQKSRDFIKF